MEFAKFLGNCEIRIERDETALDRQQGVALDVLACALCGSDLRPWRNGWPRVPGHEIVARVAEPGHRLQGRRVAVYIPIWCGSCPQCRAGQTHLCAATPDIELVGWQRPGGYAQQLRAPEQCLVPVPDDIPTELAPLLLDTIGTTGHGLRMLRRIATTGAALVVGAGPIGLGAIIGLIDMGFGPIYVSEPHLGRRAFAESLGAIAIDPATETAKFPVVIESSGKDAGRQFALDIVAPGGICLQLGEAERWNVEENRRLRLKDFFYLRTFYFPIGEFADNLRMLRSNMPLYRRLVDERAELSGLHDLFQRFGAGDRIKPVVCPSGLDALS